MSDNPMNNIASEQKPPEVLPSGEYVLSVRSGKYVEGEEDRSDAYMVSLQAEEVVELADPDNAAPNLDRAKRVTAKFYLSDKAQYIFTEWFRDTVGLDVEGESFADLAEQALGSTVKAVIAYKVGKKNGTPYNEIVRWRKKDEDAE